MAELDQTLVKVKVVLKVEDFKKAIRESSLRKAGKYILANNLEYYDMATYLAFVIDTALEGTESPDPDELTAQLDYEGFFEKNHNRTDYEIYLTYLGHGDAERVTQRIFEAFKDLVGNAAKSAKEAMPLEEWLPIKYEYKIRRVMYGRVKVDYTDSYKADLI